jgi:rhodanese-related sulfurtransferase
MQEISPRELKARIDAGDEPALVDIREEWEVDTAPFPGARHIPMQHIAELADELPRDCDIVVICHHGGRSFSAGMWLERAGFPRVLNLAGGVDGWSREVDPSVPLY